MSELVDPLPNHETRESGRRRRTRILVCDDDGTNMRYVELSPEVEAARRAYRAQYTADMRDSWESGATEYAGGVRADNMRIVEKPWYHFKRSIGGADRRWNVLPPTDLDGLPVDAERPLDDEC